MDHSCSLQKPVVTSTEVVGPGLDGACEVKGIKRLEAGLIEQARPLFDLG